MRCLFSYSYVYNLISFLLDKSSEATATSVATTTLGNMLLLLLFLGVRETTELAVSATLSSVEQSAQGLLAIAVLFIRIMSTCAGVTGFGSLCFVLWLVSLDFFWLLKKNKIVTIVVEIGIEAHGLIFQSIAYPTG